MREPPRPLSPPLGRARFEEAALARANQVYRVARRLATSREEAACLVLATYRQAFRSRSCPPPETDLGTWLLRILAGLSAGGERARRSPKTEPPGARDYFLFDALSGETGLDPQRVLARLSGEEVVEALSTVPAEARRVLVFVDIGEVTCEAAAQILDLPLETVVSHLQHGRRILKRRLAETLGAAA